MIQVFFSTFLKPRINYIEKFDKNKGNFGHVRPLRLKGLLVFILTFSWVFIDMGFQSRSNEITRFHSYRQS